MKLLELTWLARAEVILVVASLVLLAFARNFERSRAAVATVVVFASVATLFIAPLEGGAARFALIVASVSLLVAGLLLPRAELADDAQAPEAGALLLVGGVGAIVLVTAVSIIEIALGVELISLSAAALVGLGRGVRPLEGAFKYFLLTAITFATLLFGMGLVFVGSGTLDLPALGAVAEGTRPLVVAGVALMSIGLLFKLAAAPVHFGSLDAYTTGPSSFVGFIMVASKLGAAVALARLAAGSNSSASAALMIVGLVTIGVGVVASFVQSDLRRLLAYSAVAHAGFLALAAGSTGHGGAAAARFYVIGYGAAALLAFACLSGSGTAGFPLTALKRGAAPGLALGRLRAAGLLLALFSLAGVPPLPGFWVKLSVLQATWGSWGVVPTALAALGGVVGVIYYLKPTPDLLSRGRAPVAARAPIEDAVIVALMVVVVALGVWPALGWTLAG